MSFAVAEEPSSYVPWTEKYRPKSLDDLRQGYADRMAALTKAGHQMNYLLLGKPGIGKTTTAGCLANDLFGPEAAKAGASMMVNASDERNATDIFVKVKHFAPLPMPGRRKNPRLATLKKLFILDEADNMTPKAQVLLALLMEEYSGRLQFVLTANDAGRISPSIKSACLMIYCVFPSLGHQCDYLEDICRKEGVEVQRSGLEAIVEFAQQDLRQATNAVQSVAVTQGKVTAVTAQAVCEESSSEMIETWVIACWFGKPKEARQALAAILDTGYMPRDIMYGLRQVLLENCPHRIPPSAIIHWLEALGDLMLANGRIMVTPIQLEALTEEFLVIRKALTS